MSTQPVTLSRYSEVKGMILNLCNVKPDKKIINKENEYFFDT